MDQATIGYVSYRWHRICNPYSLDQLARVLDFTDLKPGEKACDLGCGNGFTTTWMAERQGLDITALERFPPVAELARAAAARPLGEGRVTVIEGRAPPYLAEAGEHRLVSAIGAIDSTLSQPSSAHSRSAARYQAASAGPSCQVSVTPRSESRGRRRAVSTTR